MNGTEQQRDPSLQAMDLLISSGQWPRYRLQRLLQTRLRECGWDDSVRAFAQDKARESNNLTLKGLLADISPHAQKSVPPEVRAEILGIIKAFVEKNVAEA